MAKVETKQRKIEFAEIKFYGKADDKGNPTLRNSSIFKDILEYVLKLLPVKRQYDTGSGSVEKVHRLHSMAKRGKYIEIVFCSFKVNHISPISNKATGKERDSDKNLNEGDSEYTHFLADITKHNERVVILRENNSSGIHFGFFKKYMNRFGKMYLESIGAEDKNLTTDVEYIITEGFDNILTNSSRLAELVVTSRKEFIKNEWETYANMDDFKEINETIDLVIKPQPKSSIPKRLCKNFVDKVFSKNITNIKRVRIRGIDEIGEPFFTTLKCLSIQNM